MALAFDAESYGSADQEVTVASPVVAQLSRPRFLAMNDRSKVALDVTNLSGAPQQLDLSWSVEGPLTMDAPRTRIALADGERKSLSYDVTATAPAGAGTLSLSLAGATPEPIRKTWSIGLRAAWPAASRQRVALLAEGDALEIGADWVAGLSPATVDAGLSLSSQPSLQLRSHLRHLLRYPYGCLEQTTSSAWPIVLATPDRQQRYGLGELSNSDRTEHVVAAMDRLAAKQLSSGGFGLWDRRSYEEQWLTAYAADYLVTASAAGYPVPENMRSRALRRLEQYLRGSGVPVRRYSESPQHYEAAYRAYAGYVLARLGRASLGALRAAQKAVEEHAQSPLPLVHLGLALIRMGDPKRGEALLQTASKRRAQ